MYLGLAVVVIHFQTKNNFKKLRLKKIFRMAYVKSCKTGDIYSSSGFALLFLQLYEKFGHAEERQHFLETAAVYLKPALKHLKSGVHSFLCGDAGVLAVAAVVHAKLGDSKTSKECVER